MSRKPMQVVFIVPRVDKPSTRYRVLQYLPFLEAAGINCQVVPFSKARVNWWRLWKQMRDADAVFVQKRLSNGLELEFLKRAARNLIYDFDDAVMYKDDAASSSESSRQMERFRQMVQSANLVIAGNSYLKNQADKFHPEEICVLPTPVDSRLYPPQALNGEKSEIVLGWLGSRSTLKYLADIIPALEELGRRFPAVKLKIVADDFFEMREMTVVKVPWTPVGEVAALYSFDIGLMPLRDDVWTRGKCGFKLLQYMAVGLPVVCTPVGINAEIVDDGVTGYWAWTSSDWVDKVERLISNPRLRADMGQRGQSKLQSLYSLEVTAAQFVNAIVRVIRKKSEMAEAK